MLSLLVHFSLYKVLDQILLQTHQTEVYIYIYTYKYHQPYSNIAQVDSNVPLAQLIKDMEQSDSWGDAGLAECLAYASKSKLLVVPDEYKDILA